MLAREYSLVQRGSFALCNISTRLTKGMRANDTQFLLIFLFYVDVVFLRRLLFSCYGFVSRFIFSTIKFMLILFPKIDVFRTLQGELSHCF